MSKLGKDILSYGAIDLLARSIGLLTSPITTRLLTVPQYGAAPLLSATWSPFALLQYGGMDYAYPYFKSSGDHKDSLVLVTTATYLSHFFTFIICALFMCAGFYGTWLTDYAGVTRLELFLFLAALLPTGILYWFLYLLRYMQNTKLFIQITLLSRIMPALLVIPLLLSVSQEDRLLASWSLGLLIQCAGLAYALYLLGRENIWPYFREKFSKDLAFKMLKYGLLLAPAAMIYSLTTVTDRILVGWFMGVESVAILQLGLAVGGIGMMLSSWFGMAFDPHLIEWIGSKNIQAYIPRLQSIVYILSGTFFGMACGAAIWSEWLFYILYPDSYIESAKLVPLLLLAGAFPVVARVGIATILIANRPRLQTGVYLAGFLVNLVIGLWAIPRFGVIGAVFGTVMSEVFILTCWLFLGKYVFRNFNLSWWPTALVATMAGVFLSVYDTGGIGTISAFMQACMATIVLAACYFFYLRLCLGKDDFVRLVRYPLWFLK